MSENLEELLSREFKLVDRDNDNRISRPEWIDRFGDDSGFDAHDRNHDGTVSREEFMNYEEVQS